jgi:Tol biopolymer transport system component
MPLYPGSRLGVYEIVSLIGRGGMGEVYRGRDARLGRDVALKLLPDAAAGVEWRARFTREARTLASLSHPNIATIYGFEDSTSLPGSPAAIVMELVEGETLAERLKRGALPLDEAIAIAAQMAGALEAAHEKGIIHRDLKPANVKVTPDGTVKILDFGLAKILPDATQEGVTLSAVTAPAVFLGTPAYMSPEQVQGRPADTRVDIWAFGVMLYEMLAGERFIRGETLQETLSAVLTADPEWQRVPRAVHQLLRACLERDPRRRLRHIGDHRFLLAQPDDALVVRRQLSGARMGLMAGIALAALALGVAAGAWMAPKIDDAGQGPSTAFATMLPDSVSVTRGPSHTSSVAVSPDGRVIVIAASDRDGQRLYRRSLDSLETLPVKGSDRGLSPFFSWDGKWIGFFADGRLKRVAVQGGAAVNIAEAPGFSAGASWGPDDRIVFAYGADSHLRVVAADGGAVESLTESVPGRQPEVIADGRLVLFESAGQIRLLNRSTGEVKPLMQGMAPRYAGGRVIFSRGSTLLAAPIDLGRLELTGAAVPLLEGVATELPGSGGGRHYAVSRSGTLVYVPAAAAYELVVLDSRDRERVIGQPQRSFENPRFSPDGRSVVAAVRRRDDEPADLWIYDVDSENARRMTTDGGRAPLWDDDNWITYSHLGERQGIYVKRVDGPGEPKQVLPLDAFHWLVGRTPDRAALLFGLMTDRNRSVIMAHRDGKTTAVADYGSTWGGRLSRDGRWLAYYALRSGTFEVYVAAVADGTPQQVTEGTDPAWAADASELFYRSGPRLMAARLDKSGAVKVISRRVVVDPFLPPLYDDYDIHPKGQGMVVVRPANQTQGREVAVVTNLFDSRAR